MTVNSPQADAMPPMPGGHPEIASIGRRIGAVVIDSAIVGLVATLVYVVLFAAMFRAAAAGDLGAVLALSSVMTVILLVLGIGWVFFLTWMQVRGGSPGQRLTRVRVVRRVDGSPLSYGAALGRNLIFGLAGSIVVGYFSPLFDSSGLRQGWHDKIVDALMVSAAPAAGTTAPAGASSVSRRADAPPPPPPARPAPPSLPGAVPPPPPATAAVPPPPVAPAQPWLPGALGTSSTSGSGAAAPPLPPSPAPGGTSPAAPVEVPTGLVSAVPGITNPGAVPPPPPPAPVGRDVTADIVAPAAPAAPDVDETRLVPPRVERRSVVLRWDDGVTHEVTGTALFGRNPAREDAASVIAVADTTRSLSKTHFELIAEPGGVFLVDRHSTNGTFIGAADANPRQASPGERVALQIGDLVTIGDRSFTLEEHP